MEIIVAAICIIFLVFTCAFFKKEKPIFSIFCLCMLVVSLLLFVYMIHMPMICISNYESYITSDKIIIQNKQIVLQEPHNIIIKKMAPFEMSIRSQTIIEIYEPVKNEPHKRPITLRN